MATVRVFLLALALGLFGGLTIEPSETIAATAPAFAAAPPEAPAAKAPDIDVHIDRGSKTEVWFLDPVVLAVGVGAIVLVIFLIGMVSRGGGGTTIIREK
jgi:hypothetical protein